MSNIKKDQTGIAQLISKVFIDFKRGYCYELIINMLIWEKLNQENPVLFLCLLNWVLWHINLWLFNANPFLYK